MIEEEMIPQSKNDDAYSLFRTPNNVQAIYEDRHNRGESGGPYVIELKNKNQRLVFFGSSHTADPKDPQINDIETLWGKFNNSDNPNKVAMCEGGIRHVEGMSENDSIINHAETGLVCCLADRDGVQLISPEPERREEVEYLYGKGYSFEQIINYYFARQMLQWVKYDHITHPDWREYISDGLERFGSIHEWGGIDITMDKLLQIYNSQTGNKFSVSDEESLYKVSDPYQNPVSAASGRLRDEKLYNSISEKWNAGFDIFVVYGSSHAIVLEPALIQLTK